MLLEFFSKIQLLQSSPQGPESILLAFKGKHLNRITFVSLYCYQKQFESKLHSGNMAPWFMDACSFRLNIQPMTVLQKIKTKTCFIKQQIAFMALIHFFFSKGIHNPYALCRCKNNCSLPRASLKQQTYRACKKISEFNFLE